MRTFLARCGKAFATNLVESELCGHRRGSFTGAFNDKAGRVEAADAGTLFLDEIGELPLEAQVKLLRLLQDGEIAKVGADTARKLDLRIIAATHRNLLAMVEDGTFREDLYYRLSVVPLQIPPLRERRKDIPALMKVLFQQAQQRHDVQRIPLHPQPFRS